MGTPRFTIVVPAYNEQEPISQVLEDLVSRYADSAEIIVVDDGSTDNTEATVKRFPQVQLVSHKRNFGYGAALKSGILSAETELVCLFDGDGQHNPDDVQRLLDVSGDADLVVASRGASAYRRLLRAPGKLVLQLLANFLVGRRIPDLNSGLRVLRREMMLRYLHLLPNGFSASTTMTMIALSQDYEVRYVSVSAARRKGRSQVRQVRDGLGTIMLILRMLLLFRPMKFFTPLSALLVLGGSVYGFYKLAQTGFGLSVGSLLIILLGIISFLFGLICDQISHLRLEKYEQPESMRRFQKTGPAGEDPSSQPPGSG